ncbi:unnamed protein product [Rhizoctonia solani]|uniref:Uncharacterized protein n=1 Tax=Rhizoctonia solani TaxID=456999 RepID=A0A8H2WG50_9AGAM|nr:unnamed protein product [Rhizoctonia solani]
MDDDLFPFPASAPGVDVVVKLGVVLAVVAHVGLLTTELTTARVLLVDIMASKLNSRTDGDVLIQRGYGLVMLSLVVLLFGIYMSLLSPTLAYFEFLPSRLHSMVAADIHYKYLPFLIVPAGLLFVIANWVGWQYYQNS